MRPETIRRWLRDENKAVVVVSHAVGIGVHYKTPIGPIRLDFGYNLNPPAFPSFQSVTNTVNDVCSGVTIQRTSVRPKAFIA